MSNMTKSRPRPRRQSPPASVTKGGRRHGCGGKIKHK